MKTPSPPAPESRHRPPRAFTLIELMVVMTIIGILAGIAVAGASTLVSRAREKSAFNDANQLKLAITSYYTEYRKFPKRNPGTDDGNSPDFSNHVLMDILLPSDAEAAPGGMNPRRHSSISFSSARPMGRGKFRSGVVVDADGGGELWDPWGNYFRVVMDTDYNNRIPAPGFDKQTKAIHQSVIVWSPGSDGKDAAAEDNIMTWRP